MTLYLLIFFSKLGEQSIMLLIYLWASMNAWMVFSSELDGCECDACGVGSDWEKFLCGIYDCGEDWVSFFQLKLGWFHQVRL